MADAIEITMDELEFFMELAYKTKHAIWVHGGIGIGKSTKERAVAWKLAKEKCIEMKEWNKLSEDEKLALMNSQELREKTFVNIDMRGTQLADGSDVKGIPKLTEEYVKWILVMPFKYMSLAGSRGILFLDELNLSMPTIQASLYQIINDRCIVDTPINSEWGIISAGNRTEDKCHSYEAAFPMRNRFSHIELLCPTSGYWIEKFAEPAGLTDMNPNVIAFLIWKNEMLYKVNAESNDYAYPTPRSVEWAIRQTDKAFNLTDDQEFKVMASNVGKEFASQYREFVEVIRKLPVEEILKNPKLMERYANDTKTQCGLMIAFLEKFRKDKKMFEKIGECAMLMQAELGAYVFKGLKNQDEKYFLNNMPKLKLFKEFKGKYLGLI